MDTEFQYEVKSIPNEEKVICNSQKRYYIVIKRLFDVSMSAVALIVLSPIFLLACVLIAISDGFPLFFNATRIGKDKKEFVMYKFRTMRKGSDLIHEKMKKEYGNEEVSFKLKDSEDPRIIKFGYFLRKFGIDELPQLINIIKGDMSIVGPRPLPDYEARETAEKYGEQYDKRYQVPQGLTCIWQAYARGDCPYEERMEMDCKYAEIASVKKDISLIWDTFLVVICGKNEY